jgi:hypothetical protein
MKTDHLKLHALAKLHAPDNHVEVTKKLAQVHGYKDVTNINESVIPVFDILQDSDYAKIRHKKTTI